MRIRLPALSAIAVVTLFCNLIWAEEVVLRFKNLATNAEITIHSRLQLPVSGTFPEYTVLCSTNMQTWLPVAAPIQGGIGVSDEVLRLAVPTAGPLGFYQVVAAKKLAPEGTFGDNIYGYATEFSRQLQAIGQLSLEAFRDQHSLTNPFLGQISFDPTTAEYWSQFNLDPAVHNATNSIDPRLTDFRLSTNELAVFRTNGFVVSQRLGSYSFTEQFYKIYTDDLPVFFSCDAALHAWHSTFRAILEELEEVFLAPRLETILTNMAAQVSTLAAQSSGTVLADGVLDADMFLAVGRSLVTGTNNYGSLGQNLRVQTMLNAISNKQPAELDVFGWNRVVDFSQFQVRGHYENSERLKKYFRAMMWSALIDFRFTGFTNDNSLRELSGALAMSLLMSRSGQTTNWEKFEEVLQLLIGVGDSLNFSQLADLLAAAHIQQPIDLPNIAALQNFQAKLMSGEIGVQQIRSGYFFSPLGREQIKLPRSFTFIGQRFVLDGWALSKCVFDDIIWDSNGIPDFEDKVMRRVPSALDVAFSVLMNNHTVPFLADRIANTNGHPWRDGYPYQHNLVAIRNVVEAQDSAVWSKGIYNQWLACLRELSAPTTAVEYPEAMRTRAWGLKTLNTQLASWTQLKHDTLLYAKQPYSGPILCLYPDGFVEPRPIFWAKMAALAASTRALLSTLPKSGTVVFDSFPGSFTESLFTIFNERSQLLQRFESHMTMLQGISQSELSRQLLSTNQTLFLQDLIEVQYAYTGVRTFSGWYPSLFYHNARMRQAVNVEPSDQSDQLVTDVHTDPAAPLVGDPGSILHEGVGNVLLLMIAVDCAPGDQTVYAGPVFSHYEFELGPTTRKTDSQWKADVAAANLPPQPDWTRGYQVP